ncbi:hypothetical protein ANCCEY_05352 [Ancylostoma ceylanicum]|uniref:Uncharacterized protein n=1 Tax=Ancylostoma ceylanicum TaxID=53326 RepID=A0A0D6LU34_9BILA|nr:hypothetical protein ANCCEY_05352 [Ancylostoma ceylanicum]
MNLKLSPTFGELLIHCFQSLDEELNPRPTLQRDAKESVKQFELSGNTYPIVIEHLREEYGDTQALVNQPLHKLGSTTARNERLEEQEKLCEQPHSIVSQLHLIGEHIENTFLQKQLLAKLSVDIQRHISRQKESHESDNT